MFFHVRDLELRAGRFDVELAPGQIEFLDPKLKQAGPLKASGTVELSAESISEIRVAGHVTVEMIADCDRCLEPARFPVDWDFELFYRPVAGRSGEETVIDESEAEMGFYEGDGIELNDVLREYVLLALPMQRVCSEIARHLSGVRAESESEDVRVPDRIGGRPLGSAEEFKKVTRPKRPGLEIEEFTCRIQNEDIPSAAPRRAARTIRCAGQWYRSAPIAMSPSCRTASARAAASTRDAK